MRNYYREVVYYLHQPQSMGVKYFFLAIYTYCFIHCILIYQNEFMNTFLRKRARIKQIEYGSAEPISREEHEKLQTLIKLT